MSIRKKTWLTFCGIIILAGLAGIAIWPNGPDIKIGKYFKELKYHLGLDLQGGAHLVYETDVSKIPLKEQGVAILAVRDVIEKRINAFGISEPIIQTTKEKGSEKIIIELPGIKDVSQAINMIGQTPILEFKEQDSTPPPVLTEEQKKEIEIYNVLAKQKAENVLQKVLKNENFANLAKEFSDCPSKEKGGDLGWFSKGMMVPEFEKAAFNLKKNEITKELIKTDFGYHIIQKTDERETKKDKEKIQEIKASHILIKTKSERDYIPFKDPWKYTGLTGKQLKKATLEFDSNTSEPQVSLEFDKQGKELFGELTKKNIGKPVAIFLDGAPISVPVVREAITTGQAVISGNFSLPEAQELIKRLNAGALPVPIKLVSQQTIGPSLGKISIQESLKAGIIGIILVALYMILFYRFKGFLSVIALGIYTAIVLAIFKLIPVTLTLAGISGFILSIGMAVDANILIFSRIREELKAGKPRDLATEEGFKRAWLSIRDSNVSTLITCFILYWFGTSMVRGFGITLSIGVLISMFSAITITRTLLILTNLTLKHKNIKTQEH
ncbi:MAG: protein translocase subunit SecD [Candidatus Kuenenbacteria bacterium]